MAGDAHAHGVSSSSFVRVVVQDNVRQHLAQFLVMAEALRLGRLCQDLASASREHMFWTRDVVVAPSIRMRDLSKFNGMVHTALLASQGRERLRAIAREMGANLRHLTVRSSEGDPDPSRFFNLVMQYVLRATPRLETLSFGYRQAIGTETTANFAFLSHLPRLTTIRATILDEELFAQLWWAIRQYRLRLRHVHVLFNRPGIARRFIIPGHSTRWGASYLHFLKHCTRDLVTFTLDVPPWSDFGFVLRCGIHEGSMPNLRFLRVHGIDCIGAWPGSMQSGCRALWHRLLPQLEEIEMNGIVSARAWQTLKEALRDPTRPPAMRLRRLGLVVRRCHAELDEWLVPAITRGRLPCLKTVEIKRPKPLDEDGRVQDARYIVEMQRTLHLHGVNGVDIVMVQ